MDRYAEVSHDGSSVGVMMACVMPYCHATDVNCLFVDDSSHLG